MVRELGQEAREARSEGRRRERGRAPVRAAAIAALALLGIGCAAGGGARNGATPAAIGSPGAEAALVATDLVSVLMQLPPFSPFSTTLQLSPPVDPFGEALLQTLAEGGYGIQHVTEDQGQRYVAYRVVRGDARADDAVSYAVDIAELTVERRYHRRDEGLVPAGPVDRAIPPDGQRQSRQVPAGPVRVIGVEPVPVVVNDDLHRGNGGGETFPSGVVFLDRDGELLERRDRLVSDGARAGGERLSRERFLVLARANLFHAGRLHRAPDALETLREPRWQLTLRFEDGESLHLGASNKRALARLRERLVPATDRFSISGCSHGKSLLWDGTESQALARSQRIKEELLLAGVPPAAIREEGCFDTRYGAELEPNAVIVTLERYGGGRLRPDLNTVES